VDEIQSRLYDECSRVAVNVQGLLDKADGCVVDHTPSRLDLAGNSEDYNFTLNHK